MVSQCKAVFFDRDGIVNHDFGYVHKPEDFVFMEGVAALLKNVHYSGYKAVMVTNQSGIARGMYTCDDFWALTEWMQDELAGDGAHFDSIYFCPHHPTAGKGGSGEQFTITCDCRKPAPGMLFKAEKDHAINLTESIMIGDSQRDISAAIKANLKQAIWLCSAPDKSALEALSVEKAQCGASTDITIVNSLQAILPILQIQ